MQIERVQVETARLVNLLVAHIGLGNHFAQQDVEIRHMEPDVLVLSNDYRIVRLRTRVADMDVYIPSNCLAHAQHSFLGFSENGSSMSTLAEAILQHFTVFSCLEQIGLPDAIFKFASAQESEVRCDLCVLARWEGGSAKVGLRIRDVFDDVPEQPDFPLSQRLQTLCKRVTVRFPRTEITSRALAKIRKGYVYMLSAADIERQVRIVADKQVWIGTMSDDRIVVEEAEPEMHAVSVDVISSDMEPQDAVPDLEEVAVNIDIELGSIPMSLAEIQNLGPGSSLPLSEEFGTQIRIVNEGKLLGEGKLILVDRALGVRITKWFLKLRA
ncbi:FliM/FliN family flagellar motor switch protein [uncultured Tateyamaria sp.]|uniref:FliM/FliN family flagellar motor switch protein n=1 Tax=uncultured Tateyamaria sp. TaxID=455651 RepID=UPI00262B6F52|nr:FliM/FliN family flagellar motor switch protein [uncultured Tateyamaria sp.]